MLVFSPVTHDDSIHFGMGGGLVVLLWIFLNIFHILGEDQRKAEKSKLGLRVLLQPDTDHLKYIGQDSAFYLLLSRRFASMVHTLQNAVAVLIIYSDNTLTLKLHCVLAAAFYLVLFYKQPRGRTLTCL